MEINIGAKGPALNLLDGQRKGPIGETICWALLFVGYGSDIQQEDISTEKVMVT